MGILFSFLLFGLWSLAFPLGKLMLELAPPLFLTAIRMLFAGFILLSFLFFKKRIPKLSKKEWISLFFLSLFSIYLTNILEFWSLSHLSAAKTCFIYSLTPFISAFLSYVHFKEKMTPLKWAGLSFGSLGTLFGILYKENRDVMMETFLGFSLPELAMIGASVCTVYGWVIMRLILKKSDTISPFFANGASMSIGGVMALITSLFFDAWTPLPVQPNNILSLFSLILVLTLLSNIVCYNFYGFLLKRYTATFLSFFGLFSPLFVSLQSWILFKETPSLPLISSSGVILLGLWFVFKEEKRLGYFKGSEPTPFTESTK